MLKTYRIIPLVFILFFFGFTLISVSLVSADEHDAFVQCQQMPTQPNNYKSLKRQKNCFRDVAKRLGAKKREGAFGACQRIKPNRVSTQKMQQKIDCFMDVASSLMPNTAPPAGATGMPPTMAAPPAAPPAAPQMRAFANGGGIMGGNNAPLPPPPSDATPAAVADGPWDKSMGMRHPDRPCMKVNSCGPDMRSPEKIASDPYDTPTGRADHQRRLAEHRQTLYEQKNLILDKTRANVKRLMEERKVASEPCQFAFVEFRGTTNDSGKWGCSDGCTMGTAMGESRTGSALHGQGAEPFCVPKASRDNCDTIRKKGYKHRTLTTRHMCGIPGMSGCSDAVAWNNGIPDRRGEVDHKAASVKLDKWRQCASWQVHNRCCLSDLCDITKCTSTFSPPGR